MYTIEEFAYRLFGFDTDLKSDKAIVGEISDKPYLLEPFNNSISISDFGYVDIGIPFSIAFPDKGSYTGVNLDLTSAEMGPYGPKSIVDRVRGEAEWVMSRTRFMSVTVLPNQYLFRGQNSAFAKKMRLRGREVVRLGVNEEVWGTDGDVQFILWVNDISVPEFETITDYINRGAELNGVIGRLRASDWMKSIDDIWKNVRDLRNISDLDQWVESNTNKQNGLKTYDLPDDINISSKICVDGQGKCLRVSCDNSPTFLNYKLLKRESGRKEYTVNNRKIPIIDVKSRESYLAKNPDFLPQYISILDGFGLNVDTSEEVYNWLDNKENELERSNVKLEQWVKEGDSWSEKKVKSGIREKYSQLYQQKIDKIEQKVDWNLWPFQKDDLARSLIKGDVIYAAEMTLGKTRQLLSWIEVKESKRNIVVLESRLIGELLNEVEKIGFGKDRVNVIESAEDAKRDNLNQLNVISYSRIWRPVTDKTREDNETPTKTIAHLLRETYFNTLFFDEAHRLKGGKSTKQANYSRLIRSKHTVAMSGTIINSYPKDLYPVLCITFGENTLKNEYGYQAYPVIDENNPERFTSGYKKFRNKFVQIKDIKSKFESGEDIEYKGKEIPEVPEDNLSEWHDMIDCRMIRRVQDEPKVAKYIDIPEPNMIEKECDMTESHAKFYKWWIDSFYEWFYAEKQKSDVDNDYNINQAKVLAQLNKLRFVSTFPQSEKVNVKGTIEWDGGLTQKQQFTLDKTLSLIENKGENVLIFAESPGLLKYMRKRFRENHIDNRLIYGKTDKRKRYDLIDEFKGGDVSLLLISRGCGQTGLNLGEAATVLSMDWCWTASRMRQSEYRILRTNWKTEERKKKGKKPKIFRLIQKGTIDEYMKQHVDAKSEGAGEAIDRQDADLNPEAWLSWKDFTIKMFKDMGFNI